MNNLVDRNIAEAMRDEMAMRERILSLLNESPRTVPEVADALECSANNAMFWMMAMWRYGSIEEVGKRDGEGYYRYQPVL